MATRLHLHKKLCEILGCPERGDECRCYFQPPESVKIRYPAIVYSLSNIDNVFADNGVYMQSYAYQITVIDKNPDSEIVAEVSKLSMCRYNRHFTSDNLNHDVFVLNY